MILERDAQVLATEGHHAAVDLGRERIDPTGSRFGVWAWRRGAGSRKLGLMARKLRVEAERGINHVLNRGNCLSSRIEPKCDPE